VCLQEGGDKRSVQELTAAELDSVALTEISKLNRQRIDAERFEVITAASVLKEPFSIENGTLTQTMKLRRNAVYKLYEKEVSDLLAKLR
jgi:long-subunit acyl-CoA synthetase (AMP-forming)